MEARSCSSSVCVLDFFPLSIYGYIEKAKY